MEISKISWSLAVYLMLIEGIALFLLDLGTHAFFIGFISLAIVLLLYKATQKTLPLKINNKTISGLPIATLSALNGLFMLVLFLIQDALLKTFSHMLSAVYGFLSVFVTIFLLILIYNENPYKVSFKISNQKIKLNKISVLFALYAGLFEFFIMPAIFYFFSINLPGIYNGLISGLVGGLLGVLVSNLLLKKWPVLIK
jgi:hypothetical protein